MVLMVPFYNRKEPVNFCVVVKALEIMEEFICNLVGEVCGSGSCLGEVRAVREENLAFFLSMDRLGVPDEVLSGLNGVCKGGKTLFFG
jgi:hypothetical protein